MQIKIIDDSTVDIIGNIKSLDDYNEIKRVVQNLTAKGAGELTINVRESLSMVSSVIGFFIKLINVDGVKLRINVWDERLYHLLDQLSLVDLFGVRFMKHQ
jgi:hypothetical protein